jgi:hypothetical protein
MIESMDHAVLKAAPLGRIAERSRSRVSLWLASDEAYATGATSSSTAHEGLTLWWCFITA